MDNTDSGKKSFSRSTNKKLQELTGGLGKLPPQAVEVEESVLGALMIEKDALTQVIDILKPESFYSERHQAIYNAILVLFERSEPIDLITVVNQLKSTGELELAGGPFYITSLTSKVNSAANVEHHARIIIERAIKRELISVTTEIQKLSYEDTTDVFELLDKTEAALFRVSEANIRKQTASMRDVMREAITDLENKKDFKGGVTGVPSGFTALDRITAGWQRSDLIIIAARPGMGKTAFILSAIRNASVDFNMASAVFSLEMSNVQLVNRLISAEAELESEKLRKGNLEPYEWEQLHHRIAKLTNAKIFIDDTPALSILELRAKCRRLKAQHDIQIVVVDYLQLMQGDTAARKSGNREQEIASISRGLKELAKELSVPVLALSQLSRAVETRGGDKRPQLSDLRESGSIEQDADMVMFLYRPEYYGIMEDEAGNPMAGVGEVIIAKNRHGSIEDVPLRFIGKFTKFCDLEYGSFDHGSSVNSFPDAGNSFDAPKETNAPSGSSDGTITMSSKMNSGSVDFDPTRLEGDAPF